MDKNYCPSLSLIKFICAIGIVWLHQGEIIGNYNFPFATNGILVELFYAITGLLTYKHFYYQNENTENIMIYSAKKYIRLFPYSCFSILGCYFVTNLDIILEGNIHGAIYEARDLPLELLLLRSAVTDMTKFKIYNGILWFLSAMFIVLPFFCFLCTVWKKHALMISVFCCELWYIGTNVNRSAQGWKGLCRAMAGLMLGVIIFHVAKYIRENTAYRGGVLKSIEILSTLFIIISLFKNYNIPRVQIILFVLLISVVFSQRALQLKYNISIIKFLGDFSVMMYFAHPIAQKIAIFYLRDFSGCVLIYLFLSFILSVLLYSFRLFIKKRNILLK